ncbi:MAG: sugar phosphate isomerase/epimerase, partial [Verrucomicrobiales bacterium]|nr:sugar phosphate isomerase/epimerase [Verrucomicrobiales bacterium]
MNPPTTRRQLLRSATTTAGVTAALNLLRGPLAAAEKVAAEAGAAGKVRHSACKWCYPKIALEDLCVAGKELGLESIELLDPPDFPTLQKYDLHCAMVSFPTGELADGTKVGGIPKAFNRLEHHDVLVEIYEPLLQQAAAAGFNQVICFSGNRDGMDDEQGLENCATGLRRLLPSCEKHGVRLVMELLNSKVNHRDYMCDHSDWGVALCEKLGSEHFALLYDIYHMQI